MRFMLNSSLRAYTILGVTTTVLCLFAYWVANQLDSKALSENAKCMLIFSFLSAVTLTDHILSTFLTAGQSPKARVK
jgi:hypothetical protein